MKIDESKLKEGLKKFAGFKIEYDKRIPPRFVTVTDKEGNLAGTYHVGYFMRKGKKLWCPDFDREIITGNTGPNDGWSIGPGQTGTTGVPEK